ncbi:MAG: hypothetical protein J6B94_02885 [Lachnospiraceae bacterium]|nr:hypothetical protein [Lachnospiraceae bacterium]
MKNIKRLICNLYFWLVIIMITAFGIKLMQNRRIEEPIGKQYKVAIWDTTEVSGVTGSVEKQYKTGIDAKLLNESEYDITSSLSWGCLQMIRDNVWHSVSAIPLKVPVVDETLEEESVTIRPGEAQSIEIRWSPRLGELETGNYRVALFFSIPEDITSRSTWVYFQVE